MDRLIKKYNKYDAMDFVEYYKSDNYSLVLSPWFARKSNKISMEENIFTEEDLVNWLLFTEEELVDFATYVLEYGNKQDGQVYHATYMNWLSERKPEIYKRTTRDQKINTILQ